MSAFFIGGWLDDFIRGIKDIAGYSAGGYKQ